MPVSVTKSVSGRISVFFRQRRRADVTGTVGDDPPTPALSQSRLVPRSKRPESKSGRHIQSTEPSFVTRGPPSACLHHQGMILNPEASAPCAGLQGPFRELRYIPLFQLFKSSLFVILMYPSFFYCPVSASAKAC